MKLMLAESNCLPESKLPLHENFAESFTENVG